MAGRNPAHAPNRYGSVTADGRILFVFGSPRSGTTWLQLLLDQHPGVVTAPETQIFAFYLSGFRRQWEEEVRGAEHNAQGGGGLSQLLTAEDFRALCRTNAEYVLTRIAERDPEATVVVEKSPLHAMHASFIHEIFPDAWFLHVIRDPRDTVASLVNAGRGWGRHWAPGHAVEAARLWRRSVEKGRELAGTGARYREIRYEELRQDTSGALRPILEWLGLDAAPQEVDAYVEACRLQRLQTRGSGSDGSSPVPGRKVPKGFFRKGTVGGWKADLSRTEAKMVERIAGPLMEDLGYAPAFARSAWSGVRIGIHDGLARVRESVDWQLQRLLRHV
jgi:LPS sulfotransferase NodH